MNTLPDPVLDTIYRYKHQLEFKHVMDELARGHGETWFFHTRPDLIDFLNINAEETDCVILASNKRICVHDYI